MTARVHTSVVHACVSGQYVDGYQVYLERVVYAPDGVTATCHSDARVPADRALSQGAAHEVMSAINAVERALGELRDIVDTDHLAVIERMLRTLEKARAEELALDAVVYLLRRIGEDPDLGYYLGFGMESFRRLCLAWAAHTGRPLAEVEEEAWRDRQPPHRKREPEVLELRKRLEQCTCGASDDDEEEDAA